MWWQSVGGSTCNVDFLIALFDTEEEEYKQQSAAEKKSETTSYHRNQHHGSSSENPSNWYRRAYDTRWRSHGSPSKRILEGSETDRQFLKTTDLSDDEQEKSDIFLFRNIYICRRSLATVVRVSILWDTMHVALWEFWWLKSGITPSQCLDWYINFSKIIGCRTCRSLGPHWGSLQYSPDPTIR